MAAHDYWFISRAKRVLDEIPDAARIFAETAVGRPWNMGSQLAFQSALSVIKPDTPRGAGTAGGGARTYKAILESLGLIFVGADRIPRLTLAGEALTDPKPPIASAPGRAPRAILTRQVLRFQYPSVYSTGPNVRISSRFQLRPMILLLRLILEPALDGYLTETEIARRVIHLGERDSAASATRLADVIKADRSSSSQAPPLKEHLHVANTIANWLDYTELVTRRLGQITIAKGRESAVDEWIESVGAEPLIDLSDGAESFQRRYGKTAWKQKDTRRNASGQQTKASRDASRVEEAFRREVTINQRVAEFGLTTGLIESIASSSGVRATEVERLLPKFLAQSTDYLAKEDRDYRETAFAGTARAREFEQLTARFIGEAFEVDAVAIAGGARALPDVLVVKSDSWGVIIDNKAYREYGLGIDDIRAMKDYVSDYGRTYAIGAPPLRAWTFVAGGLAKGIDTRIRSLTQALGEGAPTGSAVSFDTWWRIIELARRGEIGEEELAELLGIGRAVTASDIELLLRRGDSGQQAEELS